VLTTVFAGGPGATLRLVREAAGLSLGAMSKRVYFSKSYLSNLERGRRRVTPAVVRGYLEALGDDVNRRQLLMTLLAATAAPSASAEALGRAFEMALDEPPLAVDDWLARLETYGRDYMLAGAGERQARLAADLARLQNRLDHPVLVAVAAKLLVSYGMTMQGAANGEKEEAVRWYLLAVRAADRSGDAETRAWVRGRAAHTLADVGSDLPVARSLAEQALTLSEKPTPGRLHGLLALAHAKAFTGDHGGALTTLGDARRTFDVVGSDEQISDFAVPEWRMATFASLVLSRLGEERLAVDAQETADLTRPTSLPRHAAHIELHRALMMSRSGDREGGVLYARRALEGLPPEQYGEGLRRLMAEIKSA
jgi:transcriptional regulator with XRE-family HTH domain